jgi:Protein of Unknown function (DUF2604).
MAKNKETLTIVVSGEPVNIEVNLNAPLKNVVERALGQTGNVGQPLDKWELKDHGGALLDLDKKVGDYGFAAGTKLFLNLKAGVAGD